MTSEVIVDVQKKDISIALLEDKRLVEFQQEGRSEQYSVGNIYLAKIRKIMPGLNACFVNVGYERDAFLHYLDLGVRYRQFEHYLDLLKNGKRKPLPLHKVPRQPNTEKDGHIQNTVKVGQRSVGADRQGTHFHQRTSRHLRNLLCGSLSRPHPLHRQGQRLH